MLKQRQDSEANADAAGINKTYDFPAVLPWASHFIFLYFDFLNFLFIYFSVFSLFRATPMAYGGSQARGLVRAAAAGLRHSSR